MPDDPRSPSSADGTSSTAYELLSAAASAGGAHPTFSTHNAKTRTSSCAGTALNSDETTPTGTAQQTPWSTPLSAYAEPGEILRTRHPTNSRVRAGIGMVSDGPGNMSRGPHEDHPYAGTRSQCQFELANRWTLLHPRIFLVLEDHAAHRRRAEDDPPAGCGAGRGR